MSIQDIAAIASLIAAFAALAGVLVSFFNRKSIQNLHIDIDGRMEQLLDARAEASEAKGVAKERQETRDRSVSEAEDAARIRNINNTKDTAPK